MSSLTSPSAIFTVSVEDNGIFMSGPGFNFNLFPGGAISITSTGPITLQGSTILLGSEGRQVARVGDMVKVIITGAVEEFGTIEQGSPNVFT